MPHIFDNEQELLAAVRETLKTARRADFCVGTFHLRGWNRLHDLIEGCSGGEGNCCRLLLGTHDSPFENSDIDESTTRRRKEKFTADLRDQLARGVPSNEDEAGLRRLARQIKARKVVIKLFLRHALPARIYLLFRPDPANPVVAYLGSTNLTAPRPSDLNIDVPDPDGCRKLAGWFEERWHDRGCIDVSIELAQVIEESWARAARIPPYQVYVKLAYHLSQEARLALAEFRIPADLRSRLLDFQAAAVKIAAQQLTTRGGVLIGDVAGLGKTLLAIALARIFGDDFGLETLILCPRNLVRTWEDCRDQHRLRARVLPLNRVVRELRTLHRYRLVIIDESHTLRNRDGKRFTTIQQYLRENESMCVLLSATPSHKTYHDLANQLRLYVPEDRDLGARPERLLHELGQAEFSRLHPCQVRSLAAFEQSKHPEDWRELMRLHLVRRTRSFIRDNYLSIDPATQRQCLTFEDGSRTHLPGRLPRTVKYPISDKDPSSPFVRLHADEIVAAVNQLALPRYGLAGYVMPSPHEPPSPAESRTLEDLSHAGKQLMGFCRTNFLKRLESSGPAFLQAVERHILRNYVFLHALDKNRPPPLATQAAELLDTRFFDEDADAVIGPDPSEGEDEESEKDRGWGVEGVLRTDKEFKRRATEVYADHAGPFKQRFQWLRPSLFAKGLANDLRSDAASLLKVLKTVGEWDPARDAKLDALVQLLTRQHPREKALVFTQFADTVRYLEVQLRRRGVEPLAGITGDSTDPTALAWRFSPLSNQKRQQVAQAQELRVLLATDVLSEGLDLQDAAIVVNYDLPWALTRLVQRASRVDRVGQQAENIICYSLLPADGGDRVLRQRAQVRQRLRDNGEETGSQAALFEDDRHDQVARDLFAERAGTLDSDEDGDVDLTSHAYQIWRNAVTADPSLQMAIAALPPVGHATRAHAATEMEPAGVLVFLKTVVGNGALAWMDGSGRCVTESRFAILQAAECTQQTPALPRRDDHHELVHKAIERLAAEEKPGSPAGQSAVGHRTSERLKRLAEQRQGTPAASGELLRAIDEMCRHPLQPKALDTLSRQLRSGISDHELATLVIALQEARQLCLSANEEVREPRIICALGLAGA
jgi:superfamily II DNA or RNA helicase